MAATSSAPSQHSSKAISISTDQPITAHHHRATSLTFPLPSPSSFGTSPVTPFGPGSSLGSAFMMGLGRSGSMNKGVSGFFSTSPSGPGGNLAVGFGGSGFSTGSLGESAIEDEDDVDPGDLVRPTASSTGTTSKPQPPSPPTADRLSPKVSINGFTWPSAAASSSAPASTSAPSASSTTTATTNASKAFGAVGSDKFASHAAANERGVSVLRRMSLGQGGMKRPTFPQPPSTSTTTTSPTLASAPASAPIQSGFSAAEVAMSSSASSTGGSNSPPGAIGRAGGRKMSVSGKGIPGKRSISPHGERMLTGGLGM